MSLLTSGLWVAVLLLLVVAVGLVGQWFYPRDGRIAVATIDALRSPGPHPPRQGHYLALFLCFAAFLFFGSLVPFQFVHLEFTEAIRRFNQICHLDVGIESRSDFLANFLLGLPLGFCGVAALNVDRPGLANLIWQSALVLPICIILSSIAEFSQLWLPARDCSQNDIASQSLGAFFGVLLWVVAGRWFTGWCREFYAMHRPKQQLDKLLQAYCAVLLLYSLLPLDLTINPGDIYHKWRDGMISLTPFPYDELTAQRITENLGNGLLFATLGMLAASRQPKRPFWYAALWGLSLSAGIEFAQLFVVARYTKISDIVAGTLAAMLGACAAMWISSCSQMKLRNLRALSEHPDKIGNSLRRDELPVVWPWLTLAILYALLLVVVFTAPFQWLNDPVRIAKRWRNFGNYPFAYSKYWSDPLEALEDVIFKLLLFASEGALLSRAFAERWITVGQRRRCHLVVVLACAALATTIEILQVHLPPHIADETDILIAATGAWLGVMVVAHLHRRSPASTNGR